jgi:hypothetical protein
VASILDQHNFRHEDVLAALQFLVGLGATAVAGQIILKRLPEIDGRWYHDLRPITKQLAADQPLAAVLLYRKMAKAVLNEARSKHYPYAAKDVLSAGQVAEAVTDWKGHEDHAVFMDRIRKQHGRKSAFWPLLEEKPRRRSRA